PLLSTFPEAGAPASTGASVAIECSSPRVAATRSAGCAQGMPSPGHIAMGDIPKKARRTCTGSTMLPSTLDRRRHCKGSYAELVLSLVSSGNAKASGGAEGVGRNATMSSPTNLNDQSAAARPEGPSTATPWAPGPSGVALTEQHPDRLQRLARRNLWMHFTRMGSYDEHHAVPVIARGEGCYVYDEHGKRYLDGLAALYCVNVGYGRAEIAQAAAAQMSELAFYTNWSYAHPPSIELAARIAALAPGNLNR